MEKEDIVIISVITILMLLLGGWQTGFFAKIFSVKSIAIPEGIILFYGGECPHCKNVEDFISANKIEDKMKFTRLEVWYNKDNQAIIAQVAQKCGITSSQIGVPLLYDGKNCFEGEIDAINFFKNAANIK